MCMDGPSNAPGSGHAENVPLATGSVLAQVAWRTKVDQIHLEPVVGPRTELERTSLFVERKVGHVDTTRAFRHCRDDPQHVTSRSDDRSCLGENLCRRFSFVHTAVTIITVTSLAQPTDYVPIRHKWKDRSPLFGSSNYGWKNWRTLTKAKVWLVCGERPLKMFPLLRVRPSDSRPPGSRTCLSGPSSLFTKWQSCVFLASCLIHTVTASLESFSMVRGVGSLR